MSLFLFSTALITTLLIPAAAFRANGSVVSWQQINLLGEYDFSDEKLKDSVEIKPQH